MSATSKVVKMAITSMLETYSKCGREVFAVPVSKDLLRPKGAETVVKCSSNHSQSYYFTVCARRAPEEALFFPYPDASSFEILSS